MPPKGKRLLKTPGDSDNSDLCDRIQCKWIGCKAADFDSYEELAVHVNKCHVIAFADQRSPVCCSWEGCRVCHVSGSADWLVRHVRVHTREKPYKCVIKGCACSFLNPETLTKHIEKHFKTTKRNKLLQYPPFRKQCKTVTTQYSVIKPRLAPPHTEFKSSQRDTKTILFHDTKECPGVEDDLGLKLISLLKHGSSYLAKSDALSQHQGQHNCFTLSSKFWGRRVCHGEEQVLVRWMPPLMEEQWLPLREVQLNCSVLLSDLDHRWQCELADCLVAGCWTSVGGEGSQRRKGRAPHKLDT